MNDLLITSETVLSDFETGIKNKVNAFKGLPDAFSEFTSEAKTRKIAENEKRILTETSTFLKYSEDKIKPLFTQVENEISKLIYPLRSSSIASNQVAGEVQFQSALNLINTKNENLIKSELKKSLSNNNRNDYSFSAFEIIRSSQETFKDSFLSDIGDMFDEHSLGKDYTLSEAIKKNLNEVQNQVNYYRRAVSSGKLDANYKVNRQIRQAV